MGSVRRATAHCCWVRVPCSFQSIYDQPKEARRFFVVRENGGQRPQRPRIGSHAWLKGPAAGGDPVEFAHPRHPFQAGQGGQDLPRFSTTSTFSPNEDAEQGQAVIFVSNSIFSIFGSPQWFIDQRGGVFASILMIIFRNFTKYSKICQGT